MQIYAKISYSVTSMNKHPFSLFFCFLLISCQHVNDKKASEFTSHNDETIIIGNEGSHLPYLFKDVLGDLYISCVEEIGFVYKQGRQ